MSTALFVGTFDPFTAGHDNIVRRILPLFGRVVIGVGINPDKHTLFSAEERVEAIRKIYADEECVSVVSYEDFAVDLAQRVGADVIVKGIRSVQDMEYERVQAAFNKRLGGIETLLLFAEPQLECISSSAVRTLRKFGKDYSWMLPGKAVEINRSKDHPKQEDKE